MDEMTAGATEVSENATSGQEPALPAPESAPQVERQGGAVAPGSAKEGPVVWAPVAVPVVF